MKLLKLVLPAMLLVISASVNATTTTYLSIGDYDSQVGQTITDDYSNSGYVFKQSDAVMSAVLGETDYTTTGFSNHNIVPSEYYCAGCNGSFELGFTTTSIGDSLGVYGVGFDIVANSSSIPYDALVTFGDNSTSLYQLASIGFFGLTSDLGIQNIYFGLGGERTTNGSFAIDNLSISAVSTVPVPAAAWLFGSALLGFFGFSRRKVNT